MFGNAGGAIRCFVRIQSRAQDAATSKLWAHCAGKAMERWTLHRQSQGSQLQAEDESCINDHCREGCAAPLLMTKVACSCMQADVCSEQAAATGSGIEMKGCVAAAAERFVAVNSDAGMPLECRRAMCACAERKWCCATACWTSGNVQACIW